MQKKKVSPVEAIINELPVRMKNLKKYYPFFELMRLNRNSDKYQDMDAAVISLAIMSYILMEGKLKERGLKVENIEMFIHEFIERIYNRRMDMLETRELTIYMITKLTSDGKRFDYSYYDTVNRQREDDHIRYLELKLVEAEEMESLYFITNDGIDFLLQTKEFGEESKVTIYLLLLKKQLESNDFEGVYDSVLRINAEVQKQIDQKREIAEGLMYAGKDGFDKYMEYSQKVYKRLQDEKGLFYETNTLVQSVKNEYLAKVDSEDIKDKEKESISFLMNTSIELGRTIEKHLRLLREIVSLKAEIIEIQKENRKKIFKSVFNFNDYLVKSMESNSLDAMKHVLAPLFNVNIEKSFNILKIRDMFNFKGMTRPESKIIDEAYEDVEVGVVTVDDIVLERQTANYRLYLTCLLSLLKDQKEVTLSFYMDVLKEKYNIEAVKNKDFFSFLFELNKKDASFDILDEKLLSYSEMVGKKYNAKSCEYLYRDIIQKDDELSFLKSAPFSIKAVNGEYIQIDGYFAITNFIFRRY